MNEKGELNITLTDQFFGIKEKKNFAIQREVLSKDNLSFRHFQRSLTRYENVVIISNDFQNNSFVCRNIFYLIHNRKYLPFLLSI